MELVLFGIEANMNSLNVPLQLEFFPRLKTKLFSNVLTDANKQTWSSTSKIQQSDF